MSVSHFLLHTTSTELSMYIISFELCRVHTHKGITWVVLTLAKVRKNNCSCVNFSSPGSFGSRPFRNVYSRYAWIASLSPPLSAIFSPSVLLLSTWNDKTIYSYITVITITFFKNAKRSTTWLSPQEAFKCVSNSYLQWGFHQSRIPMWNM